MQIVTRKNVAAIQVLETQTAFSGTTRYSFDVERWNSLNKRSDAAERFGRNYLTQDTYNHQLVFEWDIDSRWRYVMEGFSYSCLMHKVQAGDTGFANGFNLSLFYKINERWSIGGRYEWLRARNTLVDVPYPARAEGMETNTLAFAVHWQPAYRLNFRTELRHDWANYNNGFKPFGAATQSNQLLFGCAMTVKF